jgi:hypothetical protein
VKAALRCFGCGEPEYDVVIAGKAWHVVCALTVHGPTHEALQADGNTEVAFVECTRCHGLMWAAYSETCLGCGSTDLKAGVLT